MKVGDVMTRPARSCRAEQSAADVMRELWDHDIGALPVVDEAGQPIGMITDRDVAVAAYTQGQPPHQIRVHSAMSKAVFTTRIGDSLSDAEQVMRSHQVRRLPVVDDARRLVGVLSWSDVALAHGAPHSRDARSGAGDALLQTVAAIATPQGSLTAHENDAASDTRSTPGGAEQPRAQLEQSAKKESGAARGNRTRKK